MGHVGGYIVKARSGMKPRTCDTNAENCLYDRKVYKVARPYFANFKDNLFIPMTTTFSEHQYDMRYPKGIEHHWWTHARNQLLVKLLLRESGSTNFLLEVGCGRGVVVKSLKESGFNIHGVELAEVKPMDGAQLLVDSGTDAFELPMERRSEVTGILLLDVIEHLPEPELFLKKLESSFPKLAVVIITVPACPELWSENDTFCGHYRRYSLETLEQLSKDLNWTTKNAGYFFRLPYLPMRLVSLLGIHPNAKLNPPGGAMRLLHRLISAACQLEEAILPPRIRGSSAYAVYYPGRA
jgi:Methyltransferase domain